MAVTPPSQAMRNARLRAASRGWIQRRPWLVAPMAVLVVTSLAVARFPAARVVAIALLYALIFTLKSHAASRCRRNIAPQRTLFLEHLVIVGLHGCIVGLTGGLSSPLTPALLGPSVGTLLACGRCREGTYTLSFVVGLLVLLAVLPSSWVGPRVVSPYHWILSGAAVLYALLLLRASIVVITDSYRDLDESLDRAHEEFLAETKARAASLESIGAKVAHELKNPLAAIKGLAQLLRRRAEDERSRERLDVITTEASRMEAILQDYLSFSRPLEDLRAKPVELGVLVDEVLAVLEARAHAREVDLRREGGGSTVVGDGRRLKEALINLVSNALEATESGGEVVLTIRACEERGSLISIRDTGRGMAPEILERLGTPFFTTREDGTGLGVVLARTVVIQHGGEISYESTPGVGTTVTIQLPFYPQQERRPHVQAAAG